MNIALERRDLIKYRNVVCGSMAVMFSRAGFMFLVYQ